ncbi:ROK family protein [Microbacterium sp.]|uniref:ROK family protein n=1 Tax=Microbacterium sp. TaxID=51671 RepID=UPI0037C7DD2E
MHQLGPADIRRSNALACLSALRATEAPVTISELASVTELSRPTVEAVVAGFERRGTVVAAAASAGSSAGGRPARRYILDEMSALVAGIDAGPRNVRVLISDLRGRVVSRADATVRGTPTAVERLDVVTDTVRQALAASGAAPDRLQASCTAVSGIIGDDGRLVDSFAVPEWNGTPIAKEVARRFDCESLIENDIKLAAYAEHHMGAARGIEDILFIQIGNRISLSQTFGGQIFQGAHRSAGEVGSLRGMRWTRTSVKGNLTWRTGPSGEHVLAAASAGDAEALEEVREFVTEIAPLLSTVALVVDPARIVIGGGLSRAGELFVDMLRDEIHRLIVLPAQPEVLASPLGSIGSAAGALALAFQRGSQRLFGIPDVPVPAITMPADGQAVA